MPLPSSLIGRLQEQWTRPICSIPDLARARRPSSGRTFLDSFGSERRFGINLIKSVLGVSYIRVCWLALDTGPIYPDEKLSFLQDQRKLNSIHSFTLLQIHYAVRQHEGTDGPCATPWCRRRECFAPGNKHARYILDKLCIPDKLWACCYSNRKPVRGLSAIRQPVL